jgi:hypothetical protein
MTTQITNPFTGLFQVQQKPLSTSASKAVQTATASPTDGARLGTNAPVVQPKPQTNNATVNLQALNTATANTVQTNQAEMAKMQSQAPTPTPTLSPLQQTLQGILGVSTQLEEKGSRSLEIQQEEGVFDKKARAKQLENQILSRSQAYEKAIREAQKNEGGGLRSGVQADVNELQRRSSQELADLSIAYKVANDDYAGAWEIAQAKIDAEFEPLQQRLETLKTYYQLAQNDMTESEKMQAEQKIREQESALDFERTKQLKAYEQQIRQSDPLYQAQVRAEEASIANTYDQIRERNSPALASGEGTLNGKPQTQAQSKVHGFADRLAQSNRTISELGANFTSKIAFGGSLPNILQSSDRQAYEQAKRNFVNAILRQESGAVIADSEFASAEKQYFPVAGDKEKNILQKAQNRNTVINNLYREANTVRPAIAGDIIEDDDGKQYKVGIDGVTLEEL